MRFSQLCAEAVLGLRGLAGDAEVRRVVTDSRDVQEGESDGMDPKEVIGLLGKTGFNLERVVPFFYGLNRLYIARRN